MLRMVHMQFFELFFLWNDLKIRCHLCLRPSQLAHPPTTSSVFFNAGDSVRSLNVVIFYGKAASEKP